MPISYCPNCYKKTCKGCESKYFGLFLKGQKKPEKGMNNVILGRRECWPSQSEVAY